MGKTDSSRMENKVFGREIKKKIEKPSIGRIISVDTEIIEIFG